MNEDYSPDIVSRGEVYTTWKARRESTGSESSSSGVGKRRGSRGAVLSAQDGDGSDSVPTTPKASVKQSAGFSLDANRPDEICEGGKGYKCDEGGGVEKVVVKTKDHVSKGCVDFIFYTPLKLAQPGDLSISYI